MTETALVLCADDYGQNPGVSRGIRQLAGRGRISATSCMANAPGWPEEAAALREMDGRIGIGLHLTLTWGGPLRPMVRLAPDGRLPPLGPLLRLSLSGRLAEAEIADEIARQLDAFAQAFGRLPDFVDGHQHVHVLPGIRGPLLAVLARAGLAGRLWLRDPSDTPAAILRRRVSAGKALFVSGLAAGFRGAARRAGFDTNAGFSGFSPFDPDRDPAPVMRQALVSPGPKPLVMCHPGLPDPEPDEIAGARAREYGYLASDAFGELLRHAGLVLRPSP